MAKYASVGVAVAILMVMGSVLPIGLNMSGGLTASPSGVSIGLVYLEKQDALPMMESLGVEVIETYENFVLAKLTPDQMGALKARGIESDIIADRTRISLNSYGFDTSSVEPAIPENLRIAGYGPTEEGLYIVQFIGPVKKEWKDTVSGLGAAIHQYIPSYAFLMKMDDVTKAEVEALEFVQWVGIYQPAYKVSPHFEGVSGDTIAEILLFNGENLYDAAVYIQNMGGSILFAQDGDIYEMIRAQINSAKIPDIANLNGVYFIEKSEQDYIYNSQATWVVQTGVLGSRPIWDKGIHGENQIVCVQDTGLLRTHEVFNDPEGDPVGPSHRKILAYYVPLGATGNTIDDHDHGTHVSCSVGGDAPPYDTYNLNDGNCYASTNGLKIVMQDITNTGTGAVYPPPNLQDGFSAAYGNGARIHTNSWGGGLGYTDDALEIDTYTWNNKDFTVLFAMGNAGSAANTISEQPEAKNAISVGGCQNGQLNPNSMYLSSSRGYADDGRIKPTLLAPGDDVTSAEKDSTTGYVTWDGTSMATPQVAGQVAIVRQYFMEGWYPSGIKTAANGFTPSAALIKAALVNGAKEITGTGAYLNSLRYPNGDQGWGRCTTSDVLYFDGDARKLSAADYTGLTTGQSKVIEFSVADNTIPLEFTLVWTDYVGVASTTPELVNDLDLQVADPGGIIYKGNAFGTSYNPGYAKSNPITTDNFWAGTRTGGFDGKNVEEGVLLLPAQNAFPNGKYTVTISAFNIPQGPQPYALVVTGGLGVTSKGVIDIENTIYPREASVLIEVQDGDLNTNIATVQTVNINLKSVAEPAGETTVLTETGVNTAIFTGTKTISATNSAGVLLVNAADTITATYNDANDGSGSPAVVTDTAIVDGTPPAATTGFTVQHWGPATEYGTPTTETRYLRGVASEATVNGLTCYSLGLAQSAVAGNWPPGNSVQVHLGMRVYKRSTGGVEAEITAALSATVSRTAAGSGFQTATWTPPVTTLATGESIVVKVYGDTTIPPTTLRATFTTEQLGPVRLDANQWTVQYWTRVATAGGGGSDWFWGTATYDNNIVGFQYTPMTASNPLYHNTLNWTHSGADVAQYNVYCSAVSSGPWDLANRIAIVPVGTNTYCDLNKGQADATLWWYVVRAQDAAGNQETNTNAVQEPGLLTPWQNITVVAGWNLISVAISGPTTLPGALLDKTGGVVWTRVMWYNPLTMTDPWKQYNTGWNAALNDLTMVDNTKGVWLFVTTVGDGQICIGGTGYTTPVTTAIQLRAGWNMVGFPSDDTTYTVAMLKAACPTVTIVEQFDGAQTYKTIAMADAATFGQGKGYWIYTSVDTVWNKSW